MAVMEAERLEEEITTEVTREWEAGGRFSVDAEVVAVEVQRLTRRDPRSICTPQALVGAARSPKSKLHDLFEWDDTIAGEHWRIHQARQVLRALVTSHNGDTRREFLHVKVEAAEGYVPLSVVASKNEYRASVLAEARRYLQGAKARYGWLQELAVVWEVID